VPTSEHDGSRAQEQADFGWPQAPVGQPWAGGATDRPPWEQRADPADPESTERIQPVPSPYAQPAPELPAVPAPLAAPPPPPGAPQTTGPPRSPAPAAELIARTPHGRGPLRRLLDALIGAVARDEEREPEDVVTRLRAPLSSGQRIAVTTVRGGAGKTAVSALLGSVLAERRSDPVLALDATEQAGSLAWRLATRADQPIPPMAELAPALRAVADRRVTALDQVLDQVLPRTPRGLWVLPGRSGDQPHLAAELARTLSRLFAVSVLDCGSVTAAPGSGAVLADSHAVVVVVPATPDGVRSTLEALRRAPAGSSGQVVVALNHGGTSGNALAVSTAESAFTRHGIPVETLPHDRHLAGGTPIDLDKVARPALSAARRLAARTLAQVPQF